MSNQDPSRSSHPDADDNEDEQYLAAEDAGEEINEDPDNQAMDLDDEDLEDEAIQLQNDSIAHFDSHTDSIFCIAAHPLNPNIIATGGGDDVAYVFDTSSAIQSHIQQSNQPQQKPLLPREWENNPASTPTTSNHQPRDARASITPLQKLEGHTDSVNALTFTNPQGEYLLTAGLDGKLRAWQANHPTHPTKWRFVAETAEVPEINWVLACPASDAQSPGKNVVALGASDGSVWVYRVSSASKGSELEILHALYLHPEPCTAGAWSADGRYLATVSEDASLHVWDIFASGSGEAAVSLTAADQRFAVEGGLYCVSINPQGTMVAAGGAGGHIRVVGLPAQKETEQGGGKKTAAAPAPKDQTQQQSAGQILASLQAQTDSVETLSFSSPPMTLLASGSVDGSIALFDVARRFAVRRHIREAHEEYAVVKVEFGRAPGKGHGLTSCGMDGVVRRWDARGGTTAAGGGFVREWKGHRGEGEGGGVLGFVVGGEGGAIVTAGDDGVSLVFGDE